MASEKIKEPPSWGEMRCISFVFQDGHFENISAILLRNIRSVSRVPGRRFTLIGWPSAALVTYRLAMIKPPSLAFGCGASLFNDLWGRLGSRVIYLSITEITIR